MPLRPLTTLAILLLLTAACDRTAPTDADPHDNTTPAEDAEHPDPDTPDEEDAPPQESGPECPTTAAEPTAVFLTWQSDPTTTMTIDWHLTDEPHRTSLCFRGLGDDQWTREVDAVEVPIPHLERRVFRAEITDLEPGHTYEFQVGDFARVYRLETMPSSIDDEPLVFAAGGDTQHAPQFFELMNAPIMEHDPAFIAWGGDLAYADGGSHPDHVQRWEAWFDVIHRTLVTDEGRVVPILAGIGNHEVVDGYYHRHDDFEQTDEWREEVAPYYYSFFAFPGQPGYGVLDFGDYLSLPFLDSDHTNPVDGLQTEWLASVLQERADAGFTHIMPTYHVAAFPSHRDFNDPIPERIRTHWVPLFEEHGVRLVFENHDHTYKRTHAIRSLAVEPDGIIYVGDGSWGVLPRVGDSRTEWYIEEFVSDFHGLIVTLHGDDFHVRAINPGGEVLDEFGTAH